MSLKENVPLTGVKKDYLSERDRLILEQGFRELWKIFSEMPKDALPRVILFMDTSTRPLASGIKVLIDEIYQQRGVTPPLYRFVFSIRGIPRNAEEESKYGDLLRKDRARVAERLRDVLDGVSKSVRSNQEKSFPLFVIDDFYNAGGTFKNFQQAMHEAGLDQEELRTTYFTFFLNDEVKKNIATEWDGRLLHGSSYERHFPATDHEYSVIRGFSYKDNGAVHQTPEGGVFAQNMNYLISNRMVVNDDTRQKISLLREKSGRSTVIKKEEMTGVDIDYDRPAIVQRSKVADSRHMRALRQQIADLAVQVVNAEKAK